MSLDPRIRELNAKFRLEESAKWRKHERSNYRFDAGANS